MIRGAVLAAALWIAPAVAPAVALAAEGRLRVAVFDVELRRDGPGLLLRDIQRNDPQVSAAVEIISAVKPDILALLSFDWDYDGAALAALTDRLAAQGQSYPYVFSARPNSGLASPLDLDGDGRSGGPGDAQGFGAFTGQNGLAVLSVHPILDDEVSDFSPLLWRDLPGALLPKHPDGRPFPSEAAQAAQRLSSTTHWVVPVALPGGETVSILTFHATPPVFDGAEDRNGRRNHDEVVFWRHYLDGAFGPVPERFVLAGGANLDPFDSDGRLDAIRTLLADPRLVDTAPESPGGRAGAAQSHQGPAAQDTVDWGFGRFRVDYVLPSANWRVLDSGVVWPDSGAPLAEAAQTASRHGLVWVDLALP
ncbi:MAG: endonuclease/exonuclease/phosphatase family protein [Pseudomonadota bacterium]